MEIEHIFSLGEGKRFPYQTADTLAQSVVQSLNVIGLTSLFAAHRMRLFRQAVVGCPEVAKTQTAEILIWQFSPHRFAAFHTAIANKKGENLFCSATLNNPNTNLKDLDGNKRKYFIYFHDIISLRRKNRCFQRWQFGRFFFK